MQIVLYGGKNCSLCDRLEQLIRPHLKKLGERTDLTYIKRDIADDPQWRQAYRDRIPVLTCDDRVLLEGRPSPEQVEGAMRRIGGAIGFRK